MALVFLFALLVGPSPVPDPQDSDVLVRFNAKLKSGEWRQGGDYLRSAVGSAWVRAGLADKIAACGQMVLIYKKHKAEEARTRFNPPSEAELFKAAYGLMTCIDGVFTDTSLHTLAQLPHRHYNATSGGQENERGVASCLRRPDSS